jgi:MbtH protein
MQSEEVAVSQLGASDGRSLGMSIFDADGVIFVVVVNQANQMSIWPADRESPSGWQVIGNSGTKKECLAYIEQHWSDMRPTSLQQLAAR